MSLRKYNLKVIKRLRKSLSEKLVHLKEFLGRPFKSTLFKRETFKESFRPETAQKIQKLQRLCLGAVVFCTLFLSYGAFRLFFNTNHRASHGSQAQLSMSGKNSLRGAPEATHIESGASKADTEGAWRYKMDEDLAKLDR